MHPGLHAENTPDKAAVILASTGEIVTYKQLDERSNRLAQLLCERGLRPGDGIAIFMENNAALPRGRVGGQRVGPLLHGHQSRGSRADEVEYIVNDCAAKVVHHVVRPRPTWRPRSLPDIADVRTRLMIDGTIDGFESYEDVVAAHAGRRRSPSELEGGDMLYSSGTTGRPKGVQGPLPLAPLGEPARCGVGRSAQALYGFTPEDASTSRPRRSTTPPRCASRWRCSGSGRRSS